MTACMRDTGFDWLPAIPVTWGMVPSKTLFRDRSQLNLPDDEHLTPSQKFGVMRQADYMELSGSRVVLNLSGSDNMKHVEPNDFVIHLRSFQGGIERSELRGKVSAAYTVLAPHPATYGPYFKWLLKSDRYIQALRVTVNQLRDGQSIRYQDFGKVHLPLPPLPEQRAIADFLDRETAKIDALIEKQNELIALLQERRRAVCTRLVTLGLPGVQLREGSHAEVEALPVGWIAKPVKRALMSLDSQRIPLSAEDRGGRQGDFPYYGASGVIDHVDDFLFDEPLVLVSEDGANLVLRSTPISFVASGRYWVNNHAHVMRPRFGSPTFWAARLDATDLTPYITGSAQPKFTADSLNKLVISWPEDPDEMADIVAHLDRETAKIDALIDKATEHVALAQERRAALITAAVTGQIDVTGKVA